STVPRAPDNSSPTTARRRRDRGWVCRNRADRRNRPGPAPRGSAVRSTSRTSDPTACARSHIQDASAGARHASGARCPNLSHVEGQRESPVHARPPGDGVDTNTVLGKVVTVLWAFTADDHVLTLA